MKHNNKKLCFSSVSHFWNKLYTNNLLIVIENAYIEPPLIVITVNLKKALFYQKIRENYYHSVIVISFT